MALTREELEAAFAEEDRMALADAVMSLMRSRYGRKYLWRLLEIGKVGINPYNPDPSAMAFGCGELNVGQQLLAHMLEVDTSIFATLQQEHLNEHRSRNAKLGTAEYAPRERNHAGELDRWTE